MKYKVGDKVRILDGSGIKNYTGGWDGTMETYIGEIHTVESVEYSTIHSVGYRLCGIEFTWDERGLERADNQKIVITTDGKETLARLYESGKVTKTAKAICSPDDEFDFQIGAKTAFDRLFIEKPVEGGVYRIVGNTNDYHCFPIGEKVKCIRVCEDKYSFFRSEKTGTCQYAEDCDVKPIVENRYYSGKVVCVDRHKSVAYTVGKIYEFKDGRVEIDNGEKVPAFPVRSLDEWNDSDWALAKFIELKE